MQDRPWNDPGPRRGHEVTIDDTRPTLKAIIMDFSSVNNVDATSIQNLIDVRNQLDRYTSPEVAEWHFASVNNRWTKRALTAAGFGFPVAQHKDGDLWRRWKPVFSVAEIGGSESAADYAQWEVNKQIQRNSVAPQPGDVEANVNGQQGATNGKETAAVVRERQKAQGAIVVSSVNRPFFHIDLTSALQSAIQNIEVRDSGEDGKLLVEDVTNLQEH